MPDINEVKHTEDFLCTGTDQHVVFLPPKSFPRISEAPLLALTDVSSCQNNFGHILNTLNYKYPESKRRMSHEAQEIIPKSSSRLVLARSKTSTSFIECNKVDGRIVIPPQKDKRTTVSEPSRIVLLEAKNTAIASSLTDSKSQMSQHNSTKQDKLPSHQVSSSSSSLCKSSDASSASKSSQKYLDYLEEMELKIRYMKNDIEFKQGQILARNNSNSDPTKLRASAGGVKKQPYGKALGRKLSDSQAITKTVVPKVQQTFPPTLVPEAAGVNLTASCSRDSTNVTQSRQVVLPSRIHANVVASNQPHVYVSPDKRKVIFSGEDRTKSAASVKKALFQGHATPGSDQRWDSAVSHQGSKAQPNQNSSKNRFKLVKNVQETATKTATPISQLKKTPTSNLQNSAKLVSKYKLKRLSPTSAIKLAPSFYKSVRAAPGPAIASPVLNTHTPHSIVKKHSPGSVKKTPTLKIQSAAKLVSKYKLKRLSPTSVLKRAPLLYHGVAPEQHKHTLVSTNPSGTYSRNKLKLDKRKAEKIMPQRSGSLLKLDRRADAPNRSKLQVNQLMKSNTFDTSTFSYFNVTSQYKWSRPSLQANNSWRLKMRQKFRLSYTGAHRYASFKMDRNIWSATRNMKMRHLKSLVKIGDHLYKSNRRQLTRIRRQSSSSSTDVLTVPHHFKRAAPHRSWGMQKTKLISLQGIHFNIDSQGKKLTRTVYERGDNSSSSLGSASGLKSMLSDLKRSDENARLAASRAVYRSIAIATAKYKKNNLRMKSQRQHCIFFGRFGKCFRGDNCPYIHDPQKVAVCTRFLRGGCTAANCPFSHKASVNKMPVCLHYLRGSCSRDGCPYLHVKVNPDAPTCRDFLNGFCPLGDKCKKLHSLVCPTYSHTGTCHRGVKCPMLHRQRKKDQPSGPRASISRVLAKRVSTLSTDKPFIARATNSGPIPEQPSFISLTTQDTSLTAPASSAQTPTVQEQTKPPSSRSSFISLLSADRTLPVSSSTRITPAFLSLPEASPNPASTNEIKTQGDPLKRNDSNEPATSLKITPSFLSRP